jgi:tetratricopeptide (TPR) repeat protein
MTSRFAANGAALSFRGGTSPSGLSQHPGSRVRRAVLVACAMAMLGVGACAPKKPAELPAVAGAPKYPDFVFPAAPARLASPALAERHQIGWQRLQAGDLRAAERSFSATLKDAPGFYPSEAGLGYVALARNDNKEAASHFNRALAADAAYAPALAGRGEALLTLGDREQALASFVAAVAADPQLSTLRGRIEVLRFRGLQNDVDAARKAADAGRLADAQALYERTIAASPESPFLYRELAIVERREGNLEAALRHAQKAADLNPAEPRNFVTIAEIYEAQGNYTKAAEAYGAAAAIEPDESIDARIEELRERAAFAAMPAEYKSIETSPTVTRAQLAALFGVRLDDLLKRSRRASPVVMTDTRGNWAAPWILSVSRAGLMEAYPNHTFQPNAVVRRADLAQAVTRALSLIAAENPRLAASWRNARGRFPDLPPGHLSYPAASVAVESGVMTTLGDGTFQLTHPITGTEALAATRKLEELSGRKPR